MEERTEFLLSRLPQLDKCTTVSVEVENSLLSSRLVDAEQYQTLVRFILKIVL